MKTRYRLFQRGNGIFFLQDNITGKQESLRTRDKSAASRLLNARNEAHQQPAINREIAKAYLAVGDPIATKRDWQYVMTAVAETKRGNTRERWERAMREEPFNEIRDLKLIETQPDHFLQVLKAGTVSTNIFLRRLHNFALEMDWILKAIIPRRQWPAIKFEEKRAINVEEHEKILKAECNPEWRAYYSLLWHLGGSQSDVAGLKAEDIDWGMKVISFSRLKTGSVVQLHFGSEIQQILEALPRLGHLFPNIERMKESDRAKAFLRRRRLAGVIGVSLHCYRYAWAARAKEAGYPERFAQEALGHNSKAVHRAYARKAHVKLPALEDYERDARKVVPVQFGGNSATVQAG